MMKGIKLILMLSTVLLTGCTGLEIASELAGAVTDNRQHKCNMDNTQCKKYGLEPKNKKKRRCRRRNETNCWTSFKGGDE